MANLVDASAQAIADALAPSPQAPPARWRWGTVVSVGNDGTMNVSVGGSTVAGIRAAVHAMTAQPGDRVRVMYCGTEAIVDAVRATAAPTPEPPLLHFETASSASTSVASGSIVEVTADVPAVAGYTRKGVVQTWTSGGTGTALLGAPWITSDDKLHVKMRGNTAVSGTVINWYVMYVRD